MTGVEFALILRERNIWTPIVMESGAAESIALEHPSLFSAIISKFAVRTDLEPQRLKF